MELFSFLYYYYVCQGFKMKLYMYWQKPGMFAKLNVVFWPYGCNYQYRFCSIVRQKLGVVDYEVKLQLKFQKAMNANLYVGLPVAILFFIPSTNYKQYTSTTSNCIFLIKSLLNFLPACISPQIMLSNRSALAVKMPTSSTPLKYYLFAAILLADTIYPFSGSYTCNLSFP